MSSEHIYNGLIFNGRDFSFDEIIGGCFFKTEEEKKPLAFIKSWVSGQLEYEISTSGSTGKPKQITIPRTKMILSARATGSFFKLKRDEKALVCLSTDHVAGMMMLVRAMVLGLEIIYIEPSSNPIANLEQEIDFCALVPMQIHTILEENPEKLKLIKTIIVGGATLSFSDKERLKMIHSNVYETYGMTETVSHIALKNIQEECFTVLPNVSISQDVRACLCIESKVGLEAKLQTNDLVELINDKQFKWLGRFDSVINSGGIKIQAEELESKLERVFYENQNTSRFFVAGIPDEVLGEKVVLFVESETDCPFLKEFDFLSKYEKPKQVIYFKTFLETATGKVDKLAIKKTIL